MSADVWLDTLTGRMDSLSAVWIDGVLHVFPKLEVEFGAVLGRAALGVAA